MTKTSNRFIPMHGCIRCKFERCIQYSCPICHPEDHKHYKETDYSKTELLGRMENPFKEILEELRAIRKLLEERGGKPQ